LGIADKDYIITNPNRSNALYQADNIAVAAWANAASAAMIGDCFRISGHTDLMAAIVWIFVCYWESEKMRNLDLVCDF